MNKICEKHNLPRMKGKQCKDCVKEYNKAYSKNRKKRSKEVSSDSVGRTSVFIEKLEMLDYWEGSLITRSLHTTKISRRTGEIGESV